MSEAQTRIAISLPGVHMAEIVARCDYPVHYWELHIFQGGPDARYAPAAIEFSPLHVRDICGALRRAESRFAQLAQMTRDSDYIEPVFSRNGMSADIVASNGYKFTTTKSIKGILDLIIVCRCFSSSLFPRMPPCIFG